MAITGNIIVYDFETGSTNPLKCQPLQLAAVIVDAQRLEIVKDSEFNSLIRYLEDDEAEAAGLDPLKEDALKKNKLDREELKKAPSPEAVWNMYVEYVKNYNKKGINGKSWDAPVRSGFNLDFDDTICRRLCNEYGPKSEGINIPIYHPHKIDVMELIMSMFNGHQMSRSNRINFDTIREYMGYKKEGAHNAKIDVIQTADLLIRFFKLFRGLINGEINLPLGKKVKFKGCVNGKV